MTDKFVWPLQRLQYINPLLNLVMVNIFIHSVLKEYILLHSVVEMSRWSTSPQLFHFLSFLLKLLFFMSFVSC